MATESKNRTEPAARKRQFLGLADRDDQEWFWNDASGAIAATGAVDYSKYLDTIGDDGEAAAAEPNIGEQVLAVRRYRRIQRALDHLRERHLEAWVETLREAYRREDFVIEDGGEFEPIDGREQGPITSDERVVSGGQAFIMTPAGIRPVDLDEPTRVPELRAIPLPKGTRTVSFRAIVKGEVHSITMREVRPPRESRRSVNGEREELHLSNGEIVLKGGHVVGTEDASGEVPGLARLAHPQARRNLEESLELACRAYEEARAATDSTYGAPVGRNGDAARKRRMAWVTKSEYARLRGVTPTQVDRYVKAGRVPTFERDGREVVLLVEPEDDE